MPRKISLAVAALCLNLTLFYLMMAIQNHPGYYLLFVLLRILLLTSVIMQILIAIGVVKLERLK